MKWKGYWMLLRVLPVISWSFSAIALGFSVVASQKGVQAVNFLHLFLVVMTAVLLQGLIAHAYNDVEDWESETDRYSPGILSGGTGVIAEGFFTKEELSSIAARSIFVLCMIAVYFTVIIGLEILIFLCLGLWASIAYSCEPLKLAYRPLLGEWLCAWPAMVTCTVGTSYVLSNGTWYLESLFLGMLHATFSITWLMMHHIPDMDADLQANPQKWTTVAYARAKHGWNGVMWILRAYLLAAFILAMINSVFFHQLEIFIVSGSLIAVILYWIRNTRWIEVEAVTRTEIWTIAITLANVVGISWILLS